MRITNQVMLEGISSSPGLSQHFYSLTRNQKDFVRILYSTFRTPLSVFLLNVKSYSCLVINIVFDGFDKLLCVVYVSSGVVVYFAGRFGLKGVFTSVDFKVSNFSLVCMLHIFCLKRETPRLLYGGKGYELLEILLCRATSHSKHDQFKTCQTWFINI